MDKNWQEKLIGHLEAYQADPKGSMARLRQKVSNRLGAGSMAKHLKAGYGAVTANPGAAALGLGAAFGIGVFREGQDPIESTFVLGPALAVGAAVAANGGYSAAKANLSQMGAATSFLWKAPGDWKGSGAEAFAKEFEQASANNPYVKNMKNLMPGGNPEALKRTILGPERGRQKLTEMIQPLIDAGEATPTWMRNAAISADIQSNQGGPISVLAQHGELETAQRKWATPKTLLDAIQNDEFSENLSSRIEGFRGMSSISDEVTTAIIPKAGFFASSKKELASVLEGSGNAKLAKLIESLPDDVQVAGVTSDLSKKKLAGIEYRFGGRSFVTPMIGPEGQVKAGLNQQNLYVARKQIYAGSLQNVLGGAKAQVMELDEMVARSISEYYLAAKEIGRESEFARYLSRASNINIAGLNDIRGFTRSTETGSALLWQMDRTRRPARIGRPTAAMQFARRLEYGNLTPGDKAIAGLMNIADELEFSDGRSSRMSENLYLALARDGYAGAGSNNSVLGGTLHRVEELARYTLGSLSNSLSKPNRLIREATKPYWMEGLGETQWRPFQTAALKNNFGRKDVGMALHFQGVFPSEIEFLRRRFLQSTGPGFSDEAAAAVKAKQDKLLYEKFGVFGDEQDKVRKALQALAGTSEGQFAAKISRKAKMVTGVDRIVYSISDEIKALGVGDELPAGIAIGLDESDLPIHHNFRDPNRGAAILTRPIKAIRGRHGRTAYAVSYDERIAANMVKYGTDINKAFATILGGSDPEIILNVLNQLRTREEFKYLYKDQSYVPLMRAFAKNTAPAFVTMDNIKKAQNLTDVMLSNLSAIHLQGNNKIGAAKILSALKVGQKGGLGIYQEGKSLIFRRGNLKGKAFRERIKTIDKTLKGIFQGMVKDPASFGLGADYFSGHSRGFNAVGEALETVMMKEGVITEGHAWDARGLHTPKKVFLGQNHFLYLDAYNLKETSAYLKKQWGMRSPAGIEHFERVSNSILFDTKLPSNTPVMGLTEWDTTAHASQWRQNAKFKNTFVIDLRVAGTWLTESKLKHELGTTRLHIPGTSTDFWNPEFRTPGTGNLTVTEEFVPQVQRMLKHLNNAALSSSEKSAEAFFEKARLEYGNYQKSIHLASRNILGGSAGAAFNAGRATAGTLVFRDYPSLFKSHNLHEHVLDKYRETAVGVSAEDYYRLTGDKEFNPNRLHFGVITRPPVSSVDPALIYLDEKIATGELGYSEARRAMLNADFDADIGYLHTVRGSSRREILRAAQGKNPVYNEALNTKMALGGIFESLAQSRKAALGGVAGAFEDEFSGISRKFGSIHYFDPEDLNPSDVLSKARTGYIGQYSNLSKEILFSSQILETDDLRRMTRLHLSNYLQQVAIDFARKDLASNIGDPGQLIKDLREAQRIASQGGPQNITRANELFSGVAKKLGLIGGSAEEVLNRSLSSLETTFESQGNFTALDHTRRVKKAVPELLSNWFAPLEGNDELTEMFAQRSHAYKAAISKYSGGIGKEGSIEWLNDLKTNLRAIAAGRAVGPSVGLDTLGVGTAVRSADTLTLLNRAIAGAAGGGHILADAWSAFKGSPYASAIAGGAIVTGGLMATAGFMTSPVDMDPPSYSSGTRALMQSPDVAMASRAGAPLPGSRGGHAARTGEMSSPRRASRAPQPINTVPNRYYVQQTNRVPRLRFAASGDPYDVNQYAEEASRHFQRMSGGDATVNIVHDATSRRVSEIEIADQMRQDLRGGR